MVPAIDTTSIIEPPVMNGGIAASNSVRPQRQPIPNGPSILWPLQVRKSTPRVDTSILMCGTLWQASKRINESTARASLTIAGMSFTVPSKFDWWVNATILVRSLNSVSSDKSKRPSSVSPIQRSTAPVLSHNSCQGTKFAWCSISVTRISSPTLSMKRSEPGGRSFLCWDFNVAFRNAYETKLIASVAFFVNTKSSALAPMKLAMLDLECSKASVASSASWWAPRCAAALWFV